MSSRTKLGRLSFFSRTVAGLVLFALATACDSPTQPTRDGPGSSRNRLEIVGTTAVAPQQTTEVQAFLTASDGTRHDVTARVAWTTSDPAVLSVSSGGRVTGGAVGEATLGATLDDRSASTTVIVVPAGTFRLAGIVRASGLTSPLAGVQAQLITQSGEVLTAQTTGSAGFRFYGVAGHARLRVSTRAFQPYEVEIDIHDHLTHDVSLSSIDLGGEYTLTLSASTRCGPEFPEGLRTRTYGATIAQEGASLMVTLQSPSIFPGWNDDRFAGVFGETNDVIFDFSFDEWPTGSVTEVSAFGRMTATISAGGLSGFLDGDIVALVTNEDGRGNRWVTCTAPDHGVVLSRQ